MTRLAIFLSILIGLAWGYCWHQHEKQHRPVSAPLLPLFDPAKPAFRTNLELLLPERGPLLISELPGPEESITL